MDAKHRTCKYCETTFYGTNGRIFSNHVRWCDKNPSRNNTEKITVAVNESLNRRLGEIKEFKVQCVKCGCDFFVKEREKLYPQKQTYFCGLSCANSHPHSETTKEKIKKSLLGRQVSPRKNIVCKFCKKEFEVTVSENRIYCSNYCRYEDNKSSNEYLNYKHACDFKFNVWDYPNEFDLSLIFKHGWYQAKNRGDNLGGVSRDHKISIKFGWEHNIDPQIISHPANCKLMVHKDNISKHKKCSIILEQLKEDIGKWNSKYNLPRSSSG